MSLFEIFVIVLLMLILQRLSHLVGSVTVSNEAFLEAVRRMDAPVVVVTDRAFLWVFGFARRLYICRYKGHRLYSRSFAPLSLPPSVDVIQVRKW